MPLANAEIAGQLEKIADLLDIEGANQFRIRAYRRAARTTSSKCWIPARTSTSCPELAGTWPEKSLKSRAKAICRC